MSKMRCNMIRVATLLAAALLLPSFAAAQGDLELSDCLISAGPAFYTHKARCGTMLRPENPDDPESPLIELSVAVVPALNLNPEPDPVVPIAGGPGQSSIEFYSASANAFEMLRRDRDILIVDQRGTGESSRLTCDVDEDLLGGDYSDEQTREIAATCVAQLPHDPRYFTTSVAVRDLDAVREALGYPQLNLYGVSYGSRVAQHYARRFPDKTRSIIIDGVVPPQLPLGPDIAIEAQKALDNIIARCAEEDGCGAAFPSLADDFKAVQARLADGPVIVRLQNPGSGRLESVDFGIDQLAGAVRLLAYHQSTIAIMPLSINAAANDNFIPLAAQFQMTVGELGESLAIGMHNAVMCTEDAPFYDQDKIDQGALGNTYIGPIQLQAISAICEVWPAGTLDDDLREPLDTDIPVLLLSGDADPITPPEYAIRAMVDLSNATHLIGKNQGHGQASVGCMPRIMADFVDSGDPLGLDTECMQRSFALPFFIDFSGPQP
ncbi:MAG: alpha/beta fold hydrolase [Woeseiaceae bacterium]